MIDDCFRKYLKTYFIFDLVSAFPIELLDVVYYGKKMNWFCSAWSFLTLFRLRNLVTYVRQIHKVNSSVKFHINIISICYN